MDRHLDTGFMHTHMHKYVCADILVFLLKAVTSPSFVEGLVGSYISELACGLHVEQLWLNVSKESSI